MQIRPVLSRLNLCLLAGCLVACNSSDTSTTKTPTSVTQVETTANTESVMEHPIAPPPAILSSQKGPSGSQVDLLKAQVKGGILTVELQYKPGSEAKRQSNSAVASSYTIDQVGVADEANTKIYRVLKDQSGHYMASPLRTEQEKQVINLSSLSDKPITVWFKFPAPPHDTKTISITIPEVGSYKDIPLSR